MIKNALLGLQSLFTNPVLRKKMIYTLIGLAIYRLLVIIPVPFVNIDALMSQTQQAADGL
jgi:preprotein translocase subunit SecY